MDLKKFIDELQRRLEDGEEEIFIQDEDGWLHDFDMEHKDESFDGFYTSYPACCALKAKAEECG